MSSNKNIARFMESQAKKIEEYSKSPSELWFNERDKQAILKWPSEEADIVWEKLQRNIMKLGERGTWKRVNPFCLFFQEDCKVCQYGKHHIICGRKISDITYIREMFRALEKNPYFYPTNHDYKKILSQIERR